MFQVSYVEIPVTDLDRAIECYGDLFGVEFERVEIDGNEMALFPDDPRGVNASLAKGDSYVPSIHGTRVYAEVTDIDGVLAKVIARGLAVLYPKTSIGELGHVAEFQDSEGNRIALSQR